MTNIEWSCFITWEAVRRTHMAYLGELVPLENFVGHTFDSSTPKAKGQPPTHPNPTSKIRFWAEGVGHRIQTHTDRGGRRIQTPSDRAGRRIKTPSDRGGGRRIPADTLPLISSPLVMINERPLSTMYEYCWNNKSFTITKQWETALKYSDAPSGDVALPPQFC